MKRQIFIGYILLILILSSCGVYSLYPIFTLDTLVFPEEVIGNWAAEDDTTSILSFSRITYDIKIGNEVKKPSNASPADDLTISFSNDEEKIDEYDDYFVFNEKDTVYKNQMKDSFGDILEELSEKTQEVDDLGKKEKGDFYFLQIDDGEKVDSYKAYIVKIGEDLFLDLFPLKEKADNPNFIPVHTFMKIAISGELLELKMFNDQKLKDLFKSNLVRMSHEIVDDRVLITAQPKEIQKFLEKYAKDESVYEEILVYHKTPKSE